MRIDDLDTPCLVIDEALALANIAAMARACADAGVALRPHAKTHKSLLFSQAQMDAGAVGLTCAKVSEAERVAPAGSSVFVAYQVLGEGKRRRLAALRERNDVITGVDSAHAIAEAALVGTRANPLPVRIEVDTGTHRTGVSPAEVPSLAVQIGRCPTLRLDGLYSFEGHVYNSSSAAERERIARDAVALLVEASRAITSDWEALARSVGATPAVPYYLRAAGATELRPGAYVFMDANQVSLGAYWEQCAATVLATVVSTPTESRAVVDAGTKTLAADGVPRGKVARVLGHNLWVTRASEEHGIIECKGDHGLSVGQRVRLVPWHVCPVVNLADRFALLAPDSGVRWCPVDGRGCSA